MVGLPRRIKYPPRGAAKYGKADWPTKFSDSVKNQSEPILATRERQGQDSILVGAVRHELRVSDE
ncbi:hypothetical protein PG996_003210 [Apiospora saccharicola]|uniref:Uncharacterized protein n=1 Tax=Apiospora saccharicola TaxID=335842 RepID=A0ABR1W0N7_9PEZI